MWNPFNRRNLFSTKRHNMVANLVFALCNVKIVPSVRNKLTVTGNNAVLELKQDGSPATSDAETVDVTVCDTSTGQTKVYRIVGKEIT